MIKLGGVGTILIVHFLIWVLAASTPQAKMQRGCQPVNWVGNVATSLAALTSPEWGAKTDRGFASADYGCRYTLWRFFYEDEYRQAVAEGRIDPSTGLPTDTVRQRSHSDAGADE